MWLCGRAFQVNRITCGNPTKGEAQSLVTMSASRTQMQQKIMYEARKMSRGQFTESFGSYSEELKLFSKGSGESWRIYIKWTTRNVNENMYKNDLQGKCCLRECQP